MSDRIRQRRFILADTDKALVERLPENYRVILLESGPYTEIAVRLRIAVGTVKSRLNRARTALLALREANP